VADIRIDTGLRRHPKVEKLRRRLGAAGQIALIWIWLFARENHADGVLNGMTVEDIEIVADWESNKPGELVAVLLELRWLDQLDHHDGKVYALHDWPDWQPWAVHEPKRKAQARAAAAAAWEARRRQAIRAADAGLECEPHADSMRAASHEHAPSPSPFSTSPTPKETGHGVSRDRKEKPEQRKPANRVEELQRIVDAWNSLPRPFSKLKALTLGRRTHLLARLQSYSTPEMLSAIDAISHSSFCAGENERKWVADFDWLLKPETMTKILEGKYANKEKSAPEWVKDGRKPGDTRHGWVGWAEPELRHAYFQEVGSDYGWKPIKGALDQGREIQTPDGEQAIVYPDLTGKWFLDSDKAKAEAAAAATVTPMTGEALEKFNAEMAEILSAHPRVPKHSERSRMH
jgi:hypothetical protein